MKKFKKTLDFLKILTIIKIVAKMSGDDGEEVTPVPMPNTEVKLFSADGSWGIPPVRVGRCQADHIWSLKRNVMARWSSG